MTELIPSIEVEDLFDPTARLTSNAYQQMCQAASGLQNSSLERWKNGGGKVIGYLCSMAPEELFIAADMLGFRVRASGSMHTDLSDSYFFERSCSFPRHALNMAMEGKYDFLDGILYLDSCGQIEALYNGWKKEIETRFIEFIRLPKKAGPPQIELFTEQIYQLRNKLEEHFGVVISDDKLRDAIALTNETRRLQRQLYALRQLDDPPVTGAEILTIIVAGTALPKKEYNLLLQQLLLDLQDQRGTVRKYNARLMVTGGILDDPKWIEAVEQVGGLVVADGLCFGSRSIWQDIDETIASPIEALGRYYLADRPSCPRAIGKQEERMQFTLDMVEQFRCDGILSAKMMFCKQWSIENYMLGGDLKQRKIPFMVLEREYITSSTGQLKTRVQAFIESILDNRSA